MRNGFAVSEEMKDFFGRDQRDSFLSGFSLKWFVRFSVICDKSRFRSSVSVRVR